LALRGAYPRFIEARASSVRGRAPCGGPLSRAEESRRRLLTSLSLSQDRKRDIMEIMEPQRQARVTGSVSASNKLLGSFILADDVEGKTSPASAGLAVRNGAMYTRVTRSFSRGRRHGISLV